MKRAEVRLVTSQVPGIIEEFFCGANFAAPQSATTSLWQRSSSHKTMTQARDVGEIRPFPGPSIVLQNFTFCSRPESVRGDNAFFFTQLAIISP